MKILKNNIIAFFAITICLSIGLQAKAQNKKYSINGELRNFSLAPKLIYKRVTLGKETELDSALVIDGKYSFNGDTDGAIMEVLSFVKDPKGGEENFSVIVDEGTLNLISEGSLAKTKVSGDGAKSYLELQKITSWAKLESEEIKRLSEMEEYKTNDSLKKVLQTRSTNLLGNSLVNMISYVRKNPESSLAPFLTHSLITLGFLTPQMTDTLVSILPKNIKNTRTGKAIDEVFLQRKQSADLELARRSELDKKIPLGSKALMFTMNNTKGQPIKLESYKGKYVLIDFWASWCKPCREENPNLVKSYSKYNKKGFNILGVSIDGASQKEAWLAAIKKDGLIWTQVSDLKGPSNIAAVMYGVESIPQNFLLDPNGIIIAKNLRGDALEEKLAEIFK
jgi:peroxiredoxin